MLDLLLTHKPGWRNGEREFGRVCGAVPVCKERKA